MDFLSNLLSSNKPKEGGQQADNPAPEPPPPAVSSPAASPPQEEDVDESLPPTIEYPDFGSSPSSSELTSLWGTFEETYADMTQSLETKMETFSPFAEEFVAAYEETLPEMWRIGGGGAGGAAGHPKLVVIFVCTFLQDFLTVKTSTCTHAAAGDENNYSYRQYEEEILGGDMHDFTACSQTLLQLASFSATTSTDSDAQETTRRRMDLLSLLAVLAQLVKYRHNRRFLLHSMGHGFAHFLVSLLLALCHVVEWTWNERQKGRIRKRGQGGGSGSGSEAKQAEGDEDDAVIFLLSSLLYTLQLFHHTVPSYPHYCLIAEKRHTNTHPWSRARIAHICCHNASIGSSNNKQVEKQEAGRIQEEELQRSIRSLSFHETWSLVSIQEGVLPSLLQVLHLSMLLLSSLASAPQTHTDTDKATISSLTSSYFLLGSKGSSSSSSSIDLRRFLLLLQSETLLGVGAFIACHPHEALPALTKSGRGKEVLVSVLTSFLGLEGVSESVCVKEEGTANMLLSLAWQRSDLTLDLLKECVPIVAALHHVKGLLENNALLAQGKKQGGGGFLSSALLAVRGGGSGGGGSTSASEGANSSSSLLTVQDISGILLEGLVQGLAQIEMLPFASQDRGSGNKKPRNVMITCPPAADLPVPYQRYDLWPWKREEEEEGQEQQQGGEGKEGGGGRGPDDDRQQSPQIQRQGGRRNLLLQRSLSSSALSLPEVFELAAPFLRDPHISYRLMMEGPLLSQEEEEEGRKEGGNRASLPPSREDMYASIFTHLEALCHMVPEATLPRTPGLLHSAVGRSGSGGATTHQQLEVPSMQTVALEILQHVLSTTSIDTKRPQRSPLFQRHVILFVNARLLQFPLETIAACRHLKLWPLLLASIGLSVSSPLPFPFAQEKGEGGGADSRYPITNNNDKTTAAAWFHIQDLCLELLHRVFVAAQRPPTTNFLSSPTLEMGLVVSLLEEVVVKQEKERKTMAEEIEVDAEAKVAEDLLIFQACRWLNMMIREHDSAPTASSSSTTSASSSSRSSNSVVPAFNEHGVRLLTLLPRLLLTSLPSSWSYLRWPALHALLSLMASTIHIASVIESKLALEPWVNQVLHIHSLSHTTFGALWEFMAFEQCQGVVVFILTRFLHILAQLSVVVVGGGGSGSSDAAAVVLVEPGAVAAFYKECLAQVERWHVTSSEEEDGRRGEGTGEEVPPQQQHTHIGKAALFSLLQGLCRFLRETQFPPPVLRFHQRALRLAGVFSLIGQVLEARTAAQASAQTQAHTCGPTARELLCQGLAFLTALMAGNELNRQAFIASFLSHQVPAESILHSRLLQLLLRVAALDSFETVHVLFDLLVAGPFPLSVDGAHGIDAALYLPSSSELIIKVPGLVHLLFLLVPHLTPALQVDIFRLLQAMMAGMHGERNADIRPLLVDRLLALIPLLSHASAGGGERGPQAVAIDLLAVVGEYYISVPQLRRVVDLVHAQPQSQSQSPCCQPVYAPQLLSALDKMIQEKGGDEKKESRRRRLLPSSYSPSHYFLFDGNGKPQQQHHHHHPHYHQASGVRLRPLAPWTKKHYSFFTWVCLQDNLPILQQQHLFSFVAEDGTALETYLVPITTNGSGGDVYVLQMESRRNKATPQYIQWTVMDETSSSLSLSSSAAAAATESVPKITAGVWTFIGISHRAPSGFRSASDVLVVVNGVTFRGTLPYPGMRVLSSRSYIGGSVSASGSSGLKGKMTAVFLLDEGLKEEHLRGIYTRGPDFDLAGGLGDGVLEGALLSSRIMLLLHPGRFHNLLSTSSESSSPSSSSSFFNQEEEERGESTVTFFRTVQDWRRRAVLETLRAGGSTAECGQAVVKLCQGTYTCFEMDVRKAFQALGGVKVLLPILAQMGFSGSTAFVDTHTHTNTSALHVIDLLGKLLAQAPLGSSDFTFLFGDENDEEGSGCALLLIFLLERLPSSCLTLELVAALQSFLTRIEIAWRNPLVTATFVAHLFGNFKIWHRAPSSSVQEEVLQLLLYHLQSASSVSLYLSQLLRVEEMVAALQLFYPYHQQGKFSSSLPRYDSSSPSGREKKEGKEEQRESGKSQVRRWILEIIYKIMRATAAGGGGGGVGEGQEVMMVAVPGEDDKEGASGAVVNGLEKQREDGLLCIFNLLAALKDERGVCELLHLILRLLSPELVQVILAVPSSSPVYLLLWLAGASSPFASSLAVRLLAFSVSAKLFLFGHQMDEEKKRLAAAAAAAAGGGTGKRPIFFGSLFSTPSSPLSTMRGQRVSVSLSTSAKQRLSGSSVGTSSLSLTSGGGGGGEGERLSASMRMSTKKEGAKCEEEEDGETQLLNPNMDFVWEEGRVVEFLFWMTRAVQEGQEQTHTQQASALVVETLWSIATASTSSAAAIPLEKKERVALLAGATGLLPVWFGGLLAIASSNGGIGEDGDTSKEREEGVTMITFSAPLPALRFLIISGVADASYRKKLALALPDEEEEDQAKANLASVKRLEEKMDKAQATAFSAMATLARYRQQEGVEHLTRTLVSYEDERVWVWQRRWLAFLDEVANERAPWGPARAWLSHMFAAGGVKEVDKEIPISWTLDDVEDHLRHRCKMVRRMPHRDSVVLGAGEEEGEVAFLRHASASSKMRGKDEVLAAAAVSVLPEQQQQQQEKEEEEEEEEEEGEEQDGSVGLQLSTSIASLTLAHQQQEREDLDDMTQTSLWKELAKYQRAGKGGEEEEEEEGMEEVGEEEEEEEEDEDEEEEGRQAEAAIQEENGKTQQQKASTPSRPAAGEDTESINSSTTATSSNYSQPRPPPPALTIPSPPRRIPPLRSQSSWQSMGSSGDKEELVVITTTTTTPKTPFAYLNRAAAAAVGRTRRSSTSGSTSCSSTLLTRHGARSSVPLVDGGGAPTRPTAAAGVAGGRRKVLLRGGTIMGSSSNTRIGPTLTVGSLKESRPCEVIQPFVTSPGLFEVCKRALRFTLQEQQYHELQQKQQEQGQAPPSGSTSWCLQPFPSTLFFLHDIHALYLRLYQQQLVALEFFFLDQSSLFLNFHSKAAALAIYKAIRKLRPRHLEPHLGYHPRQIIGKMKTAQGHTLTQAWIHRELSNFDYLSYLNLVAGRTWHDWAQYPVFPWILADYSSTELDLGRIETFRDLRWPMGAQRPSARQTLRGTYRMLEEEFRRQQMEVAGWDVEEMGGPPPAPMPPFHHGSHYSTAAFVLWYLLRLEPFTSLHIHLQSGKFDHPDRQFRSVQAAYEGCVANPSDVKELIPEFFFLPDFLVNVNKFDLGVTQRGQEVGDVELPPWAKGSVDEFVRLHREALESEYVSENLHHWIDLIFGYKQRPPFLTSGGGSGGGRPASSSSSSASTALGGLVSGGRKGSASEAAAVGGSAAVESFNVFFNLTYHEALDMEALQKNDPLLYESTLKQIQDFGQTPMQLFTTPHPARTLLHNATDIIWPIASVVQGAGTVLPPPRSTAASGDEGEGEGGGGGLGISLSAASSATSSSLSASSTTLLAAPGGGTTTSYSLPKPERLLSFPPHKLSQTSILAIAETAGCDRLFTLDGAWHVSMHGWSALSPDVLPPFKLKSDLSGIGPGRRKGRGGGGGQEEVVMDVELGLLFTCGYLDNSFKVAVLEDLASSSSSSSSSFLLGGGEEDSGGGGGEQGPPPQHQEVVQSIAYQHKGIVRCLALGKNGDVRHHSHHATVTTTSSASTSASRGGGSGGSSGGGGSTGSGVGSGGGGSAGGGGSSSSGSRVYLVTGSEDCTVCVWDVLAVPGSAGSGAGSTESGGSRTGGGGGSGTRWVPPVHPQPLHVLRGHADVVISVAVHVELDLVVSGSRDGTFLVHSLREGQYIRTLARGGKGQNGGSSQLPLLLTLMTSSASVAAAAAAAAGGTGSEKECMEEKKTTQTLAAADALHWVGISSAGYLLSYSRNTCLLTSHSINGRLRARLHVETPLHAFCFSEDGHVLLVGGEDQKVTMLWCHNLRVANDGPREGLEALSCTDGSCESLGLNVPAFSAAIRSLTLTAHERHLLVGLENGELYVLAPDANYLRQRLKKKLESLGFY